MDNDQIKRLTDLLAAATPGPWSIGPPHNPDTLYSETGKRIATGMCREQDAIDFALMAELRNAAPSLLAELVRLREANETFHLRIYDTFTCPNCRGSKTQLPGFMAESSELVPCAVCKGDGWTRFADLLEMADPHLKAVNAALLAACEAVAECCLKSDSEERFGECVTGCMGGVQAAIALAKGGAA